MAEIKQGRQMPSPPLYLYRVWLLLPFFLSSASQHLGSRDVALFVNEVEISFHFLYAGLGDYLAAAALRFAPRHLRLYDVPLFIDVIKISFLALDADFRDFFRHLCSPPFNY